MCLALAGRVGFPASISTHLLAALGRKRPKAAIVDCPGVAGKSNAVKIRCNPEAINMEPLSTATAFGFIRELLRLIGIGSGPVNEHDVELYGKYKVLFVDNGAAEFYKNHDFLISFRDEYWRPMSEYVDNWHTVEHQFVDGKVNNTHKKVYKAATKLGEAVANYTVTIDADGQTRSVKPRDVCGPTPEHIKREAKEINDLRPAFANAHAKFVRLANNRLRKRSK